LNIIFNKFSMISATISPSKFAYSVFFPLNIVSIILSTIRPCLKALAMLFVFFPAAFVFGSV
jgi:hypothetical protein